jgi:hypothetical protein
MAKTLDKDTVKLILIKYLQYFSPKAKPSVSNGRKGWAFTVKMAELPIG